MFWEKVGNNRFITPDGSVSNEEIVLFGFTRKLNATAFFYV